MPVIASRCGESTAIFTKIIEGEIPGRFVWREDDVVAFLAIARSRPATPSWCRSAGSTTGSTSTRASTPSCWTVAQTIGRSLDVIYRPTKVGVLVVGEEVPHAHIHLVPFTSLSQMSFANQDTDPAPDDARRPG